MRRHPQKSISGLKEVREGIEHWRRTRTKRSPMPEKLWQSATSLALSHGIYPIARALRLDYNNLKIRTKAVDDHQAEAAEIPAGFVELTPSQLFNPAAGLELEFKDGQGRQMVLRLCDSSECDMVGLAHAFWSRWS